MKRTPAGTESDAAVEAANRKQGEYYRGLLVDQRDEISRAIVEYLDAMGIGRSCDVATARELRHIVRKAERERQALDRMIAAIDSRFPVMNRSTAPEGPARVDDRPLVAMSQRRRSPLGADRLHDKRVV
ncbi:MAG: hypothetical protein QOH57_1387 [Mycobacterium sp.]|jgi:hypothetical protein|nr:hypothetical protein [Mycobacterium sp.]